MAYFMRPVQLNNTLESFRQYNPSEFNVVIVDDDTPDDIVLPSLPFNVTIIKLKNKTWVNPSPVYNIGFDYAIKNGAKIIIIQNPECYHVGNIVEYAKNVTDNLYIAFGAYSLGKGEDITKRDLNKVCAAANGDSAWYNHPIYRPQALHFCCAITVNSLRKLNGFDERFAPGIGYDDNYFVHQINCLGLKIEITSDPYVLHQYHYDYKPLSAESELYTRNGTLYHYLIKYHDYRAVHTLTPDL